MAGRMFSGLAGVKSLVSTGQESPYRLLSGGTARPFAGWHL